MGAKVIKNNANAVTKNKNDHNFVKPSVTQDGKSTIQDKRNRDFGTHNSTREDTVTPSFTRDNTVTPCFTRDNTVTPSFTRDETVSPSYIRDIVTPTYNR